MADKGFFIAALPRDGVVTFLALVREKELKPKRNGGVYLHLVLADRTGELDAKAWDTPQETAALFERNDIVKVRGTIELYSDRPQLIIQRIRRCEAGEFNEADFCATSVRDPDEMLGELRAFAESVVEANLRSLLVSILRDADVVTPLKVAPAAMRIHHAFRAGLLEHIVSLCGLTEAMVRHYPLLKRDLLIAGCLLHDIGKIEELGTSRCLAYTTRGQLVGHVALGLEILERHISLLPGFPVEVKSMLQHLIVSHHGEIDKGALRVPMFPEALALSIADLLDARLEQAWRLIDQKSADEEWTAYVPSLERQLYRWCPLEAGVGFDKTSRDPGASPTEATAPAAAVGTNGNNQHRTGA